MADRLWPWEFLFSTGIDEAAVLHDELDCGCRSSATCPAHLAEADLTLEQTKFGSQLGDE